MELHTAGKNCCASLEGEDMKTDSSISMSLMPIMNPTVSLQKIQQSRLQADCSDCVFQILHSR